MVCSTSMSFSALNDLRASGLESGRPEENKKEEADWVVAQAISASRLVPVQFHQQSHVLSGKIALKNDHYHHYY